MTPRQQMAIAFPCARAADTCKPRYGQTHQHGKRANQRWSSILTVNK